MDMHCYCMQVSASTMAPMPHSLPLIYLKSQRIFCSLGLISYIYLNPLHSLVFWKPPSLEEKMLSI